MAIWLASYPDGSTRFSEAVAGPHRPRLVVPPWPFLRSRLRAAGGEGFDSQVLDALRDQRRTAKGAWHLAPGLAGVPRRGALISALVKVSARDCLCENGPLTGWDEECALCRPWTEST